MKNKNICNNPFQPPSGGLSLYIHVPFCEKKCNYCSFYSKVPTELDIDAWLKSLAAEINWWKQRLGTVKLKTCYVGGGTPSILGLAAWNELINNLEKNFNFEDKAEVTVEVNPNSLTSEQLLCWRDWRVTRVSIGVQSFDDAELALMGRLHNTYQAHDAISSSLASGFSVSADFIFGLPYQTFKNWGRTLQEAINRGIQHISLYQLSLEKGTPWEKLKEEDLSDGYYPYRWSQWYLPQKKYNQYEISNFSKNGHESRHNMNYWNGGEYLGVGPGASGYINGWRYTNTKPLEKYISLLTNNASAINSGERLDLRSSAKELAVLMLRTKKGINKEIFVEKYGLDEFNNIFNIIKKFPEDLYVDSNDTISLTNKGMRIANVIWREIV